MRVFARWSSTRGPEPNSYYEYNCWQRLPSVSAALRCSETVSDDENLTLNAIAQCQIGNSEILRFWLDDLVPPAITCLLLPLFEEFANDLMEGGIFMSTERSCIGADLMVFASSQHKATDI